MDNWRMNHSANLRDYLNGSFTNRGSTKNLFGYKKFVWVGEIVTPVSRIQKRKKSNLESINFRIYVGSLAGVAQSVEQRTENPRVTSSSLVPGIPTRTTSIKPFLLRTLRYKKNNTI